VPQSLSNVLVHLAFSTKDRRPDIDASVAADLCRYLAGICREEGCPAIEVGGTEDHVHLCVRLSRTGTVADLVRAIEAVSSKWMKTRGDRYRFFTWQSGYGAFSIGQSGLAGLRRYIAEQEEHRRQRDFKAEFRALLEKYGIEYHERYVWD
jgi:REP element-mobilizing transposase RayT